MSPSHIEWTDEVWNPTTGCTRVSAGCDHCYAFELHDKRHLAWKRGSWDAAPAQYHQPFSTVQLLESRLTQPLRWRTPRMVFVDSMSDLFHADVPDEYIAEAYAVEVAAYWHTFQTLTKRPERRRALLSNPAWRELVAEKAAKHVNRLRGTEQVVLGPHRTGYRSRSYLATVHMARWSEGKPRNQWEGVSVEDQRAADTRIPELLATPAAVRFLSCEPLLGAVDLDWWLWDRPDGMYIQPRIDWIITGGESGPHARPTDVEHIRSVVRQCQSAGVPVFVKQLGSMPCVGQVETAAGSDVFEPDLVKLRDRAGGDPSEWPEDLRVREWPRQAVPA